MLFYFKLATSIIFSIINILLSYLILIFSTASFQGFVNVLNAGNRFGKSRGSIFDVMMWQSSMRNPFQGVRIGLDMKIMFMVIAVSVGLFFLVRALKEDSYFRSLYQNLRSFSAIFILGTLLYAGLEWFFGNNSARGGQILFFGFMISLTSLFLANLSFRFAMSRESFNNSKANESV